MLYFWNTFLLRILILHPGHTSLFLETVTIKFWEPRVWGAEGRRSTYGAQGHGRRKTNTQFKAKLLVKQSKTIFFENSFFPSVATEWNKLDQNIGNSENLNIFKKKLLKFIRPSGNSVFRCDNPKGVKLLTRLRLDLSDLWEHKFKHSFLDSLSL